MNTQYRKTLLAGTIAILAAPSAWSAQETAPMPRTETITAEQSAGQEAPRYSTGAPESMDRSAGTRAKSVAGDNAMLALTPDDLHRQEVIGSDGETIGKISEVVSGKEKGDIYAVISTGGFLGIIGGTKHVIPLNELRLEQQKLHVDATQEELSAREQYAEEHYLVVQPDDRPIIEFSAFEQKQEEE